MTSFLAVATAMAMLAAAAVAVPLMRHRGSRLLGAAAAVAIAGTAAGLYPLWSNWSWGTPAPSQAVEPDVSEMVSGLEKRLKDEPNNLTGWLMLGRSYVVMGRYDAAIGAYGHARALDAKGAEAALGLGEAMSLRAGGEITAPAAELFEQALAGAPNNPIALLYGGFAAAARGDRAAARTRWLALKGLHPAPQLEEMLDSRIAALGPAKGVTEDGATRIGAAHEGADPAYVESESPEIIVNIRMTPALRSRLKSEAPLFVFAREPDGRGPPLAAKRLTSTAIGSKVHLGASDSMIPGRVLRTGQRVSVTARVSFAGQPIRAPGDLYGELLYEVGRQGASTLLIDRVVE